MFILVQVQHTTSVTHIYKSEAVIYNTCHNHPHLWSITTGERETGNETEKVVIAHKSVEFYEATPIGLVDESKESCTGARWTETCVAPRHVDASRDFLFFTSFSGGGGGGC